MKNQARGPKHAVPPPHLQNVGLPHVVMPFGTIPAQEAYLIPDPVSKDLHIELVLDRSGSMEPIQDKTISAVNEFLEKQQRDGDLLGGKTTLSLTLFDNRVTKVLNRAAISTVAPLTRHTYPIGSATALLDAVGHTLRSLNYETGLPRKVLIAVMTDGYENASIAFNNEQIRSLVADAERRGWAFTFLGAGINAWAQGSQWGASAGNVVNFAPQEMGVMMRTLSSSATSYRTGASESQSIYDK